MNKQNTMKTPNGRAVDLHPLARLALAAGKAVENRGAASLSIHEMEMIQALADLGMIDEMENGFTGLSRGLMDIPLGKCTCGDRTGTTGIECCNLCGFPIREEVWQPQFLHPRPYSEPNTETD